MKRKKFAAWAAALMMVLSGCADNSAEVAVKEMSADTGNGRYVEQIITPPEGASDGFGAGEFVNTDGKIVFSSPLTYERYTADGDGFEVSRLNADILDETGKYYLIDIKTLPDGSGALIYMDSVYDEDDGSEENVPESIDLTYHFALLAPDGTTTEVDTGNSDMYDFEFTKDGRLFCMMQSKDMNGTPVLCEVDTKTAAVKPMPVNTSSRCNIDIAGKYLVLSSDTSGELMVYDMEKNSMADDTDTLEAFWKEMIKGENSNGMEPVGDICEGEENSVYLVCSKGLYRYEFGKTTVEQLIDGKTCMIGMKSGYGHGVSYITYEGDDSLLVQCADNTLVRYKYDPDAPDLVKTKLRVFVLEDMPELDSVVNSFRRADPTVDVIIETGMENGKTYEDAMKELTTQVMSDDPPDVLILDGMDIKNLTDKKLLKDLSGDIADITPEGGLLEKAALWNDEGGLWSAAGGFSIPAIVCDTGSADSIHSLAELAKAAEKIHDEKKGSYAMDLEMINSSEIARNAVLISGELSDKNGALDSAAVRSFFESCKRISDASCRKDGAMEEYDISRLFISILDSASDDMEFHFVPSMLSSYTYDINAITSLKDYDSSISFKYGLNDDKHSFVPSLNAGICSSAQNADNAKAFIKCMLSDETQKTFSQQFLPVNSNCFKANFEEDIYFTTGMTISNDKGEMLNYDWKNTDDDEESQLMAYIDSMDTPVMLDKKTMEVICDNCANYIDGSMTLDEAVKAVEDYTSIRSRE